jgi:hypothetical protein
MAQKIPRSKPSETIRILYLNCHPKEISTKIKRAMHASPLQRTAGLRIAVGDGLTRSGSLWNFSLSREA